MKVLVTGGAGFIGANLCRDLAGRPRIDTVTALDDLSTGLRSNLDGADVALTVGSILDPVVLDAVIQGVDAVVHLGALGSVPRSVADPLASHEANATGTLKVLEAARRGGDPLVVVASSSSVYGTGPELPRRESQAPRPASPYAVSKLATESYALAHQHCYGLPVLALRLFNVFGPLQRADHDYAAVIPAFVSAALAGRPLPVEGDGRQTRDFTFVGTVVEILADAILRAVHADEPVNLAFGTRTDLLTLIRLIEQILGHPVEVEHSEPRLGDVRDTQADHSALRALFPDIEPVGLEAGLRATVDWLRSVR